eukprot:gnl/MRDRNA2_/MRDRNA2_52535_c0_seq1.p1 gnl/MRDRNA2_/MRDRNA2_52535_c0~~gnl/MRDRNA2_/MRDRNA2_52535_c0_seq1.p1  ORF type:complete len:265 (+),score=53.72 gnl/MRDRNA2_/MRDRNA2_52535_c0_seq1:95-889(+)
MAVAEETPSGNLLAPINVTGDIGVGLIFAPSPMNSRPPSEPDETQCQLSPDDTQLDVVQESEPAPLPSPSELLAAAIADDDVTEVSRLLTSGTCDVLEAPRKGRHRGLLPVAIAAKGSRSLDMLQLLLQEVSARSSPAIGIGEAVHGWALSFVDGLDHHEVLRKKLRLLVQFGGDVNMRLDHNGETALHVVARMFDRHRTLSTGPERNLWTQKRFESARLKFGLLLHARADPSIRNRNHETPLDLIEPKFRNELPLPQDCLASL